MLESIFEPSQLHFYAERRQGFAVAGAETVLEFTASGADRFLAARDYIRGRAGGHHRGRPARCAVRRPAFLFRNSFAAEAPAGAAFPALRLFVPRWQVARNGDTTVAVANLLVTADAPVDLIAAKVWKAPPPSSGPSTTATRSARTALGPDPIRGDRRAILVSGQGGAGPRGDRTGEYQKVVLARARQLTTPEEFHPLGVLNHLRQHYPGCYAFSIANGRGQSFIGVSPERLVRVAGGRMHTEALAGSAPRGESASETPRFRAPCSKAKRTCASTGWSANPSPGGWRTSA